MHRASTQLGTALVEDTYEYTIIVYDLLLLTTEKWRCVTLMVIKGKNLLQRGVDVRAVLPEVPYFYFGSIATFFPNTPNIVAGFLLFSIQNLFK